MAHLDSVDSALQFIQTFEQQYPDRSAYEIANRLRGYSKAGYTTRAWTLVTGFEQGFVEGRLDGDVSFAGEVTDFGHFIAALADQINQPGLGLSDFTCWTGDHTSWAGDIGSAIALYRSQPNQFRSLENALDRYASASDYAADVAAYGVGRSLNHNPKLRVSEAIEHYHATPYPEQVQQFVRSRFGSQIRAGKIVDPAGLEAAMRRSIHAYLELAPDSGIVQWLKSVISGKAKLRSRVSLDLGGSAADLLGGSRHFLEHLVRKGNLQPLQFRPYQSPRLTWLGRVGYEVTIG